MAEETQQHLLNLSSASQDSDAGKAAGQTTSPPKKSKLREAIAKRLDAIENAYKNDKPTTVTESEPLMEPDDFTLPRPDYYSVSEITRYLQNLLSEDHVTGGSITVHGELTNVKQSSRGHVYFTLKDGSASINAVMWASTAGKLQFDLEDGLDVFITGKLEIYAPSGSYSIVTRKMEPVGMGALQLAFQQIKERLESEGLFDEDHKQPIPQYPDRIGIVTSKNGAVIHDMLRVLRRKNPNVSVLLCPVAVQGEGAALEIAQAIQELNHPSYNLDLLIVGRGGGSFEDLFCFSEEVVVRAVFDSKLPVITGIGHEPDYALADAASDYSAATPTMAAEYAVTDLETMIQNFYEQRRQLADGLTQQYNEAEQTVDYLASRLVEYQEQALKLAQSQLSTAQERLTHGIEKRLTHAQQTLSRQASELEAFSPLRTLQRGYVIASDPQGKVIRSIKQVKPNENISVRLLDGKLDCHIRDIEKLP